MLNNTVNESRWYLRSPVAQKSSYLPQGAESDSASFGFSRRAENVYKKKSQDIWTDNGAKHILTPYFKDRPCDALLIQADINHSSYSHYQLHFSF